jgi:5,10-methylenetetrahydromethanopterin reductase
MDVGLLMLATPGRAREIARRTEAAGFDHLGLGDTQNLGPEVWGQLMLCAGASSSLRLGPGVTNPATRDVAVTASAALALQVESGGRAFCGIGRGDSALAKIGRRPVSVDAFEQALTRLRAYLRGGSTPRGAAESRIEWAADAAVAAPQIEVAAAGPRVIEIAARHADAIAFCVGADPETLERARGRARAAASAAGRDPDAIRYGAYVNCVVADDAAEACAIARGGVSVFARFAGWSAGTSEVVGEGVASDARALEQHYEMDRHAQAAGAGARALDDEFLMCFAVLGPPEHAIERLGALADLGLDFVTIAPGSSDMAWEQGWRSVERIGSEVLPSLRRQR